MVSNIYKQSPHEQSSIKNKNSMKKNIKVINTLAIINQYPLGIKVNFVIVLKYQFEEIKGIVDFFYLINLLNFQLRLMQWVDSNVY